MDLLSGMPWPTFTEELGPNFTIPALGARPGEGLEGNESPSAAALCPTKLADSRVLIFPNLYYKMGFAM